MSDWGSTNRLPAHVSLIEGIVLDGDLHLLTRPAYPQPGGSETPLEMLNRPDAFFALTLPEGGVALVPKAQVTEVLCLEDVPEPDPDRVTAAKHVELEVILPGGAEYRGLATLELPPGRRRTLDYMNGAGGFFALWTDGRTRYINKLHVRLIRPLD
ncbi:MAG TPA: hypothetical protein VG500_12525 [Gemmatimonadales bacterium]|jgi:hypothetical protein|nr:hypothetical protein [Gemmatimonadales bacterium]